MATQFETLSNLPNRVLADARTEKVEALGAIARLSGALFAEVLVYDRLDDTLWTMATSIRGACDGGDRSFKEAMQTQTVQTLRKSGSWSVAVESRAEEVTWLMKLREQDARSFFVALSFAKDSVMIRARVGRIGDDLAVLARLWVEGECRRFEGEEAGAAAMAALDQGNCGVIAIRSDRSIIFRNEAAASHLTRGLGLQLRRDRLIAIDDRRFETALRQVLDAPDERPAVRQTSTVMLLRSKDSARPTVIVIAPAPTIPPGAAAAHGAAALIYILDPAQGALRGLDALCQLHGLSGVESRLLINLAGGMTLGDAATEMRIKLETARTYLKQIFAKTDTHRQTDLVTMMVRYLQAFRGDFDFKPG